MNNWLNENLKNEIRKIFEPRYKRVLSDAEVVEIGESLAEVIEQILKHQWRQKYGKQNV